MIYGEKGDGVLEWRVERKFLSPPPLPNIYAIIKWSHHLFPHKNLQIRMERGVHTLAELNIPVYKPLKITWYECFIMDKLQLYSVYWCLTLRSYIITWLKSVLILVSFILHVIHFTIWTFRQKWVLAQVVWHKFV